MMLDLIIDIALEYRRIFGETKRPTLYETNDLSYADLRRQIIEAPHMHFNRQKLPFEGVSLLPKISLHESNEGLSDERMLKVTKLLQILTTLSTK